MMLNMDLQGLTKCVHGDECARNVHAKGFLHEMHARKSIKTPLKAHSQV